MSEVIIKREDIGWIYNDVVVKGETAVAWKWAARELYTCVLEAPGLVVRNMPGEDHIVGRDLTLKFVEGEYCNDERVIKISAVPTGENLFDVHGCEATYDLPGLKFIPAKLASES